MVKYSKLTWAEDGSIVITASLSSATPRGEFFVRNPLSENPFITSWLLSQKNNIVKIQEKGLDKNKNT